MIGRNTVIEKGWESSCKYPVEMDCGGEKIVPNMLADKLLSRVVLARWNLHIESAIFGFK